MLRHEKCPLCALNKMLCGPQVYSGHYGGKRKLLGPV